MAEGEEEEEIVAGADEEKAIVVVGAGDDEEKAIVLAGAGDEDEKNNAAAAGGAGNGGNAVPFRPPPGFRFTPGEDELVIYYLLPKLQGREHVPNHMVIEDNVYKYHPDRLIEKYRERGGDSWYFLSPRERKYRNGKRPRRNTKDKLGRWKASTASKKASVEKLAGDGKTKYSQSTLNYYVGPINKEVKSRWIMHEITIPDYENEKLAGKKGDDGEKDMLDQYVMCRIYVTPRSTGEEDDEAGPSGTKSEPAESGEEATEEGAELSEKQAGKRKAGKKLSEKQAGKRPAEEEPRGKAVAQKQARHPNQDRLNLGTPALLHAGNGMQAPFMTPGYYGGGGPGLPMGHYAARPPMPWPPLMHRNGQPPMAFNDQGQVPRRPPVYRNGQGQVPRQVVAYNGPGPSPGQQAAYNEQVVPMTRQTVVFNGQGPPPRQQAPYNEQMVPMTRQTVGYNGQGPPPRQQAPYSGPAQMPRQTAGFNGQVPWQQVAYNGQVPMTVVPQTAQTQRQQETELMRYNRVLQQSLQAWMIMEQNQQQQQRPMMPIAQQQLPNNLGANANFYHRPGAMVPPSSLDNFYSSEAAQQYHQRSRVPATSSEGRGSTVVSGGGGGEVSGANWDRSNGNNTEFVDSATASGSASAADGDGPNYNSGQ